MGQQPSRGLVHERPQGASDEWYTPSEVFDALGLRFDLDPASPVAGPVPWVPADRFYTKNDNGLWLPWEGRVWLNPPYGRDIPVWLDRMASHGNGIALLFARTDTRWFHRYVTTADAVVFGYDRMYFVMPSGERGRAPAGSVFFAWGADNAEALLRANLGTPMRVLR